VSRDTDGNARLLMLGADARGVQHCTG
jgi:hypothetical protein